MNNERNSSRVLIVVGAAPCVYEDMAALASLYSGEEQMYSYSEGATGADIMAIGLDAVDKTTWPIQYVATYHPDEITAIRERRMKVGNVDYEVISHEQKEGVDIVVPYEPPSGSSALLGALAGLELGYREIVLCGCPLLGVNEKGGQYEPFQEGWRKKEAAVRGRVWSMSGWTREFLGAPQGIGRKGVVVVVGAALCVHDDLRALGDIDADYMAVGLDAAERWPGRYKYMVTYEPRDIEEFKRRRKAAGFNDDAITYSHEPHGASVDFVIPELEPRQPEPMGWSGSSALLAARVARRLGYKRIILCGCPLDAGRYVKYQRGWEAYYEELKDYVRSMSGWTAEKLGMPSEEWRGRS